MQSITLLAALVLATTLATAAEQRKILSQPPEKDNSISCIGPEEGRCNFGEGNKGWGNIGDFNSGDFNIANNTYGDCNAEDDSYGIGGPEYNGCAEETQDHIVKFCSINPYFSKCHMPPVYFGDELYDRLKEAVLRCDSKIQFREKVATSKRRRRVASKAKMPRTKVVRKVTPNVIRAA